MTNETDKQNLDGLLAQLRLEQIIEDMQAKIEGRSQTTTQAAIDSAMARIQSSMDRILASDASVSGNEDEEERKRSSDAQNVAGIEEDIAVGTPTQTSAPVDDVGRAEGGSSTNVHSFHRETSKAPKSKNGQESVVEPGAREFRAAAAPVGEEKIRALPKALMSKTPLGEAEGAKGKCLFYAMEDVVFVAFERGEPPARISLRGLPVEKYALSLKADADGHYEIFGIKATEVAQFLALRRKLRW